MSAVTGADGTESPAAERPASDAKPATIDDVVDVRGVRREALAALAREIGKEVFY